MLNLLILNLQKSSVNLIHNIFIITNINGTIFWVYMERPINKIFIINKTTLFLLSRIQYLSNTTIGGIYAIKNTIIFLIKLRLIN